MQAQYFLFQDKPFQEIFAGSHGSHKENIWKTICAVRKNWNAF